MFSALSDKFSNVFRKLSGRGTISESNVKEAMAEVRAALLEADVHFEVVNAFTDAVHSVSSLPNEAQDWLNEVRHPARVAPPPRRGAGLM